MTAAEFLARLRGAATVAADHLRFTSATSAFVIIATVVGTLVNVGLVLPQRHDVGAAEAAAIALAADFVLFAPLFVLRLALGPVADEPRPAPLVAALAVLVPVRSLALGAMAALVGAGPVAPIKLVKSALLVTLVVLGATILADSVRQEVRRVNRVAALGAADAAVRAQVDGLMIEQRRLIEAEVARAIHPGIDGLANLSGASAVAELRQIAHDVVRPLSHALVAGPPAIASPPIRAQDYRLDLRRILGDATRSGRLPAAALATSAFALQVGIHLAFSESGLPLSRAVMTSLLLWITAELFNFCCARPIVRLTAFWRSVAVTAGLLVMGIAVSLLGVVAIFDPVQSQRGAVAAPLVTLALGWVLLIAKSVGRTHDDTMEELAAAEARLDWQVAHANSRLSALRGALARQLHGPVQVALNAGAIRLDRAIAAGDHGVSATLARSVAASVLEAVAGLSSAPQLVRDPRMALDRVRVTWEGLCTVTVEDPIGLLDLAMADGACASALADILTEACSDAVRHGRAAQVSVVLERPLDDILRIVVADDGVGVLGGQPGLGSAFLDGVTLSWSRASGSDGTVLTADLPFGDPALAH